MAKTRDIDIRTKLHKDFCVKYGSDEDTLIVDELNLCQGDARIDVAVINGIMHGYEIKSESDTLERLPGQISIYNQVLDKVTVIVGLNHYDKVVNLVPDWWGIKVVAHNKKGFEIKTRKRNKKNKDVNPYSVAQLLWRDETLEVLAKFGLDKGYKSKPKSDLWERLAANLPIDQLKFEVREKLKSRSGWRVGTL